MPELLTGHFEQKVKEWILKKVAMTLAKELTKCSTTMSQKVAMTFKCNDSQAERMALVPRNRAKPKPMPSPRGLDLFPIC